LDLFFIVFAKQPATLKMFTGLLWLKVLILNCHHCYSFVLLLMFQSWRWLTELTVMP